MAEKAGAVRAVMVGGSEGVAAEAAEQVAVVVEGPDPGQVEGDWQVGLERCRSAAVCELGESEG